jgi:UDP-N-acetylmuramyl pentapeptide phosphotransferase/UDP-N-acetylglucosamine-1-phosphate transferase
MVFAISLLDDIRGVAVLPRLAVHLAAAGAAAAGMLLEERGVVATLIAIPAIAWMANLYNFMDGSDGLAGGMTLIGFSAYGVASLAAGDVGLAAANFSIATAAAAFLAFNLHPARVFLGDAGSVPIGFTAAALGLAGWVNGHWAAWFPILVFSPFIADATLTLARRLLRRERVWEAHRDHYYQRLVRMGWGHRKTAWAEYVLMAACAAAALAGLRQPEQVQIAILVTAAAAYFLLAAAVERAWKHSAARR